jgi:hypothetical protein
MGWCERTSHHPATLRVPPLLDEEERHRPQRPRR